MRVLVTGGVGFVGSHVVARQAEAGDEVHATVRPGTAGERVAALPDNVTVHPVDLTDLAGLLSVLDAVQPDVVINAASTSNHPSTPNERLSAWRDDVLTSLTLLEALRAHPPQRLVHICSTLVYRPSTQPLDEKAPLDPETPRGVNKLAVAAAVKQWSTETGVPHVMIRPFSVYGPRMFPGRVMPTLLHALRTGTPFAITAASSHRDFIHVTDVARCVELVARSSAADGQVLNVGTGVETSIKDLVAIAERVTGKVVVQAQDRHPPAAPQRPHWCADSSMAAKLVGWKAEIGVAEGLTMLWEDSA